MKSHKNFYAFLASLNVQENSCLTLIAKIIIYIYIIICIIMHIYILKLKCIYIYHKDEMH